MRAVSCAVWTALFAGAIFAQNLLAENGDPPRFEIADVHASGKTANPQFRASPPRNGRYELKNATMLDLIRTAYGFNVDTIIGGPNWLELDRFDVTAKIAPGAEPDTQKTMLQSLLEERFKLAVRRDTRPIPTWVLTAGKQPHMKEADGSSGAEGCKIQEASGPPVEGTPRLMTMSPDGKATAINLGPGGTIQFTCRNMTMAAFAEGLRGMLGAQLGPNPVLDQTGLKGAWNFEVRWSLGLIGPLQTGEQISVVDAMEKQLGLKLEQKPVAKPVLVVEGVNRAPTANSPDVAAALPPPPAPKEFDVADVKLTAPASGPPGGIIRSQMQPGGRYIAQNFPLRLLIGQAFNMRLNTNEQILGLPAGADSIRVDITAKVDPQFATGPGVDPDILAPMLLNLLTDRFKMTYHREERQLTAYSLVAAKPKMKKADPDSRIYCRRGQAPPGSAPGSQVLTCQNATMALLAEQLLQFYPGLNWPVLDATGIDGGWDFTLTFSALAGVTLGGPGRGDANPQGAGPAAPDPGGGLTIFEAIEKELGLKLKAEKRPEEVIVIDHLEQKPTDN
jgi:uncharacterized protein (TIGR03435 family)